MSRYSKTHASGQYMRRLLETGIHETHVPFLVLMALAIFLVARTLAFWHQKRQQERRIKEHHCEEPPSLQRNFWYFGLDVAYEMVASYNSGSRNTKLLTTFEKVGKTFKSSSTDHGRIFTIDPQNLRAVFGGSPADWGVEPVRFEAFRPLFSEGVLITDGPAWRFGRSFAQEMIERLFKAAQLDISRLDPHIEKMMRLLPRDNSTVDLQPIFYRFTVDVSSHNIFGKSIGAMGSGQEGQYGQEFLDAFLHCLKMAGERDEVPQWTHALWDRGFSRASRIVHAYAKKHFEDAITQNSPDKSEAEDGQASQTWSWAAENSQRARDHILNVMAASFDTTAILLTNIMFLLARNPQCYHKLRQEVLESDADPDSEQIKRMTYLQSVIKESLRLHGPASFNSRIALRDTVLPVGGGSTGDSPIFVPKGDNVIVSLFALQRQKDVWGTDAEDFRPDRWHDARPKTWDFLPFSGGQRVCPGQKLALLQAAYIMFRFVQRVEAVENRDPVHTFVEDYRVATGSKNGALVRVSMA